MAIAGRLLLPLALWLAAPTLAYAQEPTEQDKAAAQDAHRHALSLFDRGQHAEALAEFQRAYALAPSFRILYNIGLSHAALGDSLAAVEAFSAYLRAGGDKLPPDRRAQVDAEVAKLSKRLAWLDLSVDEPAATVSVDGRRLPQAAFPRQIRLNSGRHTVEVQSADGTVKTQSVTLVDGGEQELHFQAQKASHSPSTLTVGSTPPQDTVPARCGVPWVAWGVTGTLGAASAVTGVLALGAHSDEHDVQRRQGIQGEDLQQARDKVANLALVTDILLVGTALSAGVSLYLTLRPGAPAPSQTSLQLSPGFVSVRRSF